MSSVYWTSNVDYSGFMHVTLKHHEHNILDLIILIPFPKSQQNRSSIVNNIQVMFQCCKQEHLTKYENVVSIIDRDVAFQKFHNNLSLISLTTWEQHQGPILDIKGMLEILIMEHHWDNIQSFSQILFKCCPQQHWIMFSVWDSKALRADLDYMRCSSIVCLRYVKRNSCYEGL